MLLNVSRRPTLYELCHVVFMSCRVTYCRFIGVIKSERLMSVHESMGTSQKAVKRCQIMIDVKYLLSFSARI